MNDLWAVVSGKKISELEKMHNNTHNSIESSTLMIKKNDLGVHPRNIHIYFEANLCFDL